MKIEMETNPCFVDSARERIYNIFPENGAHVFDKLTQFISVAMDHPGISLVVPPDLDPCLHEILAARDENGDGLERIKMHHIIASNLGKTQGKTLNQLDSSVATKTRHILRAEGFEFDSKAVFEQPACILKVLANK